MSVDQKKATKTAYDAAAEAFCEHVYVCEDCSMTGSKICPVGQPLAEAENTVWNVYRFWQVLAGGDQ